MEILEAYDLAGTLRGAAALVGCDHKTVAYWVRMRDEVGGMPAVERRRPAMEAMFAAKIDELVDRSHGRIRADVAHGKLIALGYLGSARTTRRSVAESKGRWRQKHGRRTRPWIPEAGVVDAVGLWRQAGGRGPGNVVVLRVVGVVAVPGGTAVAGQDVAVGGDDSGIGCCDGSAARRRMR